MNKGTILVTGASGFTGQHFIRAASKEGFSCIALSQSDVTRTSLCETVVADLLNKQAVNRVISELSFDYVVHLAAIAFVAHGNVDEMYRTNIVGTLNLIDALTTFKPNLKKALFISSANVYGNTLELPIDEAVELNPQNDYAVSKCAMEFALRTRQHLLPMVVVRPFNYTGRGQSLNFLVPKIVNAFLEKQPIIELGNTDVARDFSDVRDVVNAYIRLLSSSAVNCTFNVCSGKPTSLQEVLSMCSEISGHTLDVKVNRAFVRENEIKQLFGSDERLKSVIGGYRTYSFQQTLEWMLRGKD
ncbi:NAD-dependent epimerase/dehydratase family protein [Aestuariibacter halophilus]|uniref:NAD-dependent epimerase/dehydratase family protein n=1 Tax=Fluctibacter halophilus TaxID=226011 RepID=A0ABS8G9V5_9ALTE|nr:NAD-dependent epimerase/dehydratase family protein [Aestuariibacter halophilus]MCC2617224.1 NAD-dependent epimerase/dehydratase family protein [Aestuariibacter halophilus]